MYVKQSYREKILLVLEVLMIQSKSDTNHLYRNKDRWVDQGSRIKD